jgi:hypothetical protein
MKPKGEMGDYTGKRRGVVDGGSNAKVVVIGNTKNGLPVIVSGQ